VKKISEDAPKLSFIDSSPLLLPKKILENWQAETRLVFPQ
jgi:hypothetical protein